MINFMPIQRDAINAMVEKPIGVLNMPTATGKTVVIFGHILECIKNAETTKHNFIVSGPIMDLNKQTASSILTNLWNTGVINADNIDIVIANCENKKPNHSFTWFNNDKNEIDISDKANGHEPVGIPVTMANTKQERQFRLTVVCNPTLQNDEKYLIYVDSKNIINHFYFDECHTLKNSPAEKTDYATVEMSEGEAIEKKEIEKTWVNYKKIFELIDNNGSFHLISATPTVDNFEVIQNYLHVIDFKECFTFCLRPIKAIATRMLVPPKFKIAKAPKLNLSSIKALTETCVLDVENIVAKNSNYKAKILITTNSTIELKNMCEWLINLYGEKYNVFSTCCQLGKTLNGTRLNNDIRNFKELIDNSDKPCFVVHIRQIIAGIDIPSFTHAIFNMESSTNFITPIQITGRVLRPAGRWPDGSAKLDIKECGYVYINIQDNDNLADKAARTLTDFYGEIFEFIKPNFFENYSSGSKVRHKITYQFEDTIHLETFEKDTEKFLRQLAKWIHSWKELGQELNIETEIKNAIYQKAYTENLPIFYQPELKRYIDKVKDYIDFLDEDN